MTYLRTFTALAAALVATGAVAQDKVMVGEPSWPGAKVMSRVIAQVIETRLGGQTEYAPGANAVIFSAMDGGRGDIDIHPDVWLPNQASFTDEYVTGKGSVALSDGSYEGRSGFCVPSYMAQDHAMKSVYDLATPMAQELFDSDGDGKGEIWVGASGWSSTNLNRVKVRDYGIETFLAPTTEDEAVFYARLKDAIDRKEGVVFYCYEPHFVHALYDVTFIEEPEHDPAAYVMVQPDEDADWLAKSSITTGDQVKTVTVAYSRSLEKRNPAAAAFLSKIDMEASDLSQLTYQTVIKGQDVDAAVAEWLDQNGDIVDGWLGLN